MEFRLDEALLLLGKTPAAVSALVEGLPRAWTETSEEEWTVSGVVGHLIHGENTDWVVRAKTILAHGERKPFEPFDRTAHRGLCADKPLSELLAEFGRLRSMNLQSVRGMELDEAKLRLRGMHPALGPVTLGEYLAAWVVHDLSHLHQISRILAMHYRAACGPLSEYMGVLRPKAAKV